MPACAAASSTVGESLIAPKTSRSPTKKFASEQAMMLTTLAASVDRPRRPLSQAMSIMFPAS